MKPAYATVEQLQAATDFKTTAYETDRLRRILNAASRDIDERMHRHFYPLTETRTYTYPRIVTPRRATTAGFWLDADLLSLTSVTADDVSQTVSELELYPSQYGPPYSWIGITGADIDIAGLWGYSQDTEAAGALAANVSSSTAATIDVTDSKSIGIGDLIKINDERMLVLSKSMLDTGENLGADLTADVSDVTVDLSDGTQFTEGEIILIDSERMLIVDIAGNSGTVKRAYDGSVLAAHTSPADIYAPRTLGVERGAAGTTAADSHTAADSIVRNVPPEPIVELCIAEALTTYAQESAGYARTVGAGENQREARGKGIEDARLQAERFRRLRVAAI